MIDKVVKVWSTFNWSNPVSWYYSAGVIGWVVISFSALLGSLSLLLIALRRN